MFAAFSSKVHGEALATENCDEEALLKTAGAVEGDHGPWGWLYWVSSTAALLLFAAWRYGEWFAGQMTDGEDPGHGWAGDAWLALTGVSFVLSSECLIRSEYLVFYWGTAVAYGLRGVGRFLEGSSNVSSAGAYYIVMTLAIGGNAIRAGWGYALPKSLAVTAQRVFAMYACAALCMFTLRNLKLMLVDGKTKEELAASTSGNLYEGMHILIGIVEASGSLVWYGVTRGVQEGRCLRLLAAATNAGAWTVVKAMPLLFAKAGITTVVGYHLARYCQYIVMGVMFALTTRSYIKATAQLKVLSATPPLSVKSDCAGSIDRP